MEVPGEVVASSTWCRCHAQSGLSSALMAVMTPITLSSTLVFPASVCVWVYGVRGMAARWRSAPLSLAGACFAVAVVDIVTKIGAKRFSLLLGALPEIGEG